MTARRWWWAGLAVCLVIAAGVSYFASSSPDGLETVAALLGFESSAVDSVAAGSPLADYGVAGVDRPWLSNAGAGVIGSLLTLVIMLGLARLLVRRRAA